MEELSTPFSVSGARVEEIPPKGSFLRDEHKSYTFSPSGPSHRIDACLQAGPRSGHIISLHYQRCLNFVGRSSSQRFKYQCCGSTVSSGTLLPCKRLATHNRHARRFQNSRAKFAQKKLPDALAGWGVERSRCIDGVPLRIFAGLRMFLFGFNKILDD